MSRSSSNTLFFYQGDKLITVKQGDQNRAIFRNADMPLAEQQTGEASGNGLLATDDKGSVLTVQTDDDDDEEHAFSAYGHDPGLPSPRTLLGFNGQMLMTARAYLLGNGYRAFNPAVMRFTSPDNLSPFMDGGSNAYCYCAGDPINHTDPTGHLAPPQWRAPTTRELQRTRQAQLRDRTPRARAMELMANEILRDEWHQGRLTHPTGRGNRYLPPFPSRANPNPESSRVPGGSQVLPPHPATLSATADVNQASHISGNARENIGDAITLSNLPISRSSSTTSVDSWDEWYPAPQLAELELHEAISRAIQQVRRTSQ